MVSEWQTVRLGDHIDACLGKMLDQNKNQGTLHPYLRNKNVRWGSFDLDDIPLMKFVDNEHERYGLRYGDLVVCEGGEPGRCAIWKNEVPNMKIQKALHRIRPHCGLDSAFLYYWFCYAGKFELLSPYFTGTTIQHLAGKALAELQIPLPPLPEQKAIAHILGSLDDKIELNRRMNGTLEGMAQALFKSWFVDFDPVIDNALVAGNPLPDELGFDTLSQGAEWAERVGWAEHVEARRQALASGRANRQAAQEFPAAFHFTEEMGWIPEGWKAGSILEQAKLLSGGTPKTTEMDYWNGEIKWVSAKDVSQCGKAFLTETERTITQLGLNKSATRIVPKFTTVIISRGATTGRMTMLGEDMAMNQTCYGLRVNSGHHFYGYSHAVYFISSLVHAAHGSIFDTITTDTFHSSKVILAGIDSIRDFEKTVSPLFTKVLANQYHTTALTALRDTLLPKLISGELRIPDAEKLAEEALA